MPNFWLKMLFSYLLKLNRFPELGQDKMFTTNMSTMFLKRQPSEDNPLKRQPSEDNPLKRQPSEDNPLKDISQKVSNMWTNIRTRTLSGNIVEPHTGSVG